MALELANVILTAAIAAMVFIGGFWLKHIKDASINALQAAIQAKDAEIARLKNESAPAITRAYSEMLQHANRMTAEAQRLTQELDRISSYQQRKESVLPVQSELQQLHHEAKGLLLAGALLNKPLDEFLEKAKAIPPETEITQVPASLLRQLLAGVWNAFEEMNQEAGKRIDKRDAIYARFPESTKAGGAGRS